MFCRNTPGSFWCHIKYRWWFQTTCDFHPEIMIHFDSYFSKWVGSTTNYILFIAGVLFSVGYVHLLLWVCFFNCTKSWRYVNVRWNLMASRKNGQSQSGALANKFRTTWESHGLPSKMGAPNGPKNYPSHPPRKET